MALEFDSSTSEYLTHAAAILSAEPFTMAGWAHVINFAANRSVMSISLDANDFFALGVNTLAQVTAQASDPTSGVSASTGTVAADTWTHLAGVFASTTSRTSYLNGTASTANTTSVTPAGMNTTNIGRLTGTTRLMNGRIAECAIWNVALTQSEITSLAQGFSPLMIRPGSLVGYWPLLDAASTSKSRMGGFAMTWNNSVTPGYPHPRIIYPARRRILIPAAAGGTAFPWHYYQQMMAG